MVPAFQEFRIRLVQLVDHLLDLLETDPDYRHFTLDGQTLVLDDYLAIRPEQEARIRRLVQDGRLLIGPWYILPDEFLEGPEALIRNLLFGRRGCRRFTAEPLPMERIGYIPDPFGHISQLPQIAAGLGWRPSASGGAWATRRPSSAGRRPTAPSAWCSICANPTPTAPGWPTTKMALSATWAPSATRSRPTRPRATC